MVVIIYITFIVIIINYCNNKCCCSLELSPCPDLWNWLPVQISEADSLFWYLTVSLSWFLTLCLPVMISSTVSMFWSLTLSTSPDFWLSSCPDSLHCLSPAPWCCPLYPDLSHCLSSDVSHCLPLLISDTVSLSRNECFLHLCPCLLICQLITILITNPCYFLTLGSMEAKVSRNDSLAKFLNTRRQREKQYDRSIIPQRTEEEKQELRDKIGTQLNRSVLALCKKIGTQLNRSVDKIETAQ